jgi:hypothetical protein
VTQRVWKWNYILDDLAVFTDLFRPQAGKLDFSYSVDDFVTNVKKIMCTVYPLSVPIEVDVKIGKKWGELEKAE